MRKLFAAATLVVAAAAGTANAVVITLDSTAFLPVILTPPPPSTGTAGQAASMVELGVGWNAPVTPISAYATTVDCTLLLTGCTQSTGLAAVTAVAVPYSNGVLAVTSATVGDDALAISTSIQCPTTCVGARAINAAAQDLQQLLFSDGTGNLGSFVDVDVTFSLLAQFINNSSSPADPLSFGGTGAQLWIGDPLTFSAPALSYPRLSAPFLASATALPTSPFDAVTDAVQTVALELNRPYWVGLTGSTGWIASDFTGVDLQLNASADPTFAINAGWAALNPDLAQEITIQRTLNRPAAVPEPSSIVLLGAGLAILLLGGAFRRPSHSLVA